MTTWASFQPRFTASCTPMLRPWPPIRGVHVRGVAGQQHPPVAIGRGLPGHVGEPGDPGGTVDPEVGPVDGDERLAEIAQGGLAGGCRRRCSVSTTPDGPRPPSGSDAGRWHGCRGRRGGCPIPAPRPVSTSAISQLVVGSHPGKSMPAALRITLRPPSHPTRYSRPQRRGRRTARRRRRCRPARSPSPHVRDGSAPPARRPSRPGCARCGSASSPSP